MSNKEKFIEAITQGYTFKGSSMVLGSAILNGEPIPNLQIKAPLKMFNRHGLIAGATGTGKTKTLQLLSEKLSENGVPVLLMDIKGDLSGIAKPGSENPKIISRHDLIGLPWAAEEFPVEFLSISDEPGARMRATISEFGPVLLSKILGVNETQSGVISLIFKFCDDKNLPLLDIKDFRKVLQYVGSPEGKAEIEKQYGLVSQSSIGAIMRALITIEEQGADKFFGELSFDTGDFLRLDEQGRGVIHTLRLTDIQSKPALFSTFMLCLLAEIYATFPERGDQDTPELVIFIDEAHLVFKEASKALLDQITTIVKLIRSKGVGLFFVTQDPTDVPDEVLGQLGLKVQHALRAFTEKDRKAIIRIAENFPLTEFYKTSEVLTAMGIGEALVTVLNEKGIPTPLAHTLLCAPASRMDVLTNSELDNMVAKSHLASKYNVVIDRDSAFEILERKIKGTHEPPEKEQPHQAGRPATKPVNGPSTFEKVMKSSVANTIIREVTRGLLGIFGISTTTRRKRKY